MWCILNPSSACPGLSHVVFSRRAMKSHCQPQASERMDIFNSQPIFWGEEDEFCSVSRKGRTRGATGRIRWQNRCRGSGVGWWIWLFKDPRCHFRESSLSFCYRLWLINGQSNHKGIRFWCSLSFGAAVFSDQPKAMCPHLWSLVSVLSRHLAGFDPTYPVAPPNKKPQQSLFSPRVPWSSADF